MKFKLYLSLFIAIIVAAVILVFVFKNDFLMSSVRENRPSCTKFFLSIGADPMQNDPAGNSLIHWAIYSKNSELVKMLVEKKVDLNIKDLKGGTPLSWALSFGTLETVKILVENGAQNFKNSFGETSVLAAALGNKTVMFKYLFNKFGVQEGDKAKLVNNAVYNSNLEILRFLDGKGFDLSSPKMYLMIRRKNEEKKVIDAMTFLLKKGADINVADSNEKTALIEAAIRKKNEVLQFLIKKEADIELKDKSGKTALDWAKEKENVEAVKILTKAVKTADQEKENEKPSE